MAMLHRSSIYDDCCLLKYLELNSERVVQLLEHRFKSNSKQTSFDFKSFRPEQPSNNAKVSRSLLRFNPIIKPTHVDDENISLDSSSSDNDDDTEQHPNHENECSTNEDRYLNELAEWEPERCLPIIPQDLDDDDDEEDDDDDNDDEDIRSMSQSSHASSSSNENLTDQLNLATGMKIEGERSQDSII
jgi:hypothetical protein